MFNITANLKDFTTEFKAFFQSIKNPLDSYDLAPGEALQAEALDNLIAIHKTLDNFKDAYKDSASEIESFSKSSFGTPSLFSDFISDLRKVERRNRQAVAEFFELSRLGTLVDPNSVSEFNSLSGVLTQSIASQYDILKQIAKVISQEQEVPKDLLLKFSRSQEIISQSVNRLEALQKQARMKLEEAQRISTEAASVNQGMLGEVKKAISDFQSAFGAVKSGNFKLAKKHLGQMHSRIDTAKGIQKAAATARLKPPNFFTQVLFGFVKVFANIIKGFEFLVKPIQIFLNVGVFSLVSAILRVIGLANKFNLDLINNRGGRQLSYNLNVSLDPKIVAEQLRQSDEEIAALMRDTDFQLGKNTNNIYQLTKDQLLQLDAMTSSINLRRLVDESGKAITANEARMKLVNEVVTYQKTLGVEASQVSESLDAMMDGQQFTFEQATKTMAYLSKVAFVGGLSAHRLFTSFRSLQPRLTGLNTRVSGIINLISLVQKARLMNKQGEDNFLNQLRSFSTGNENLFRDVSMGLVTEEDLRTIFRASRDGALVGNRAADAILQKDIEANLARLRSDTGTNFESAVLGLQGIISTDPSLQFGYGLAKLRKSLLPVIDILKETPEQLGKFMATNLRAIEQALGPQYAQFGMDMLRVLLHIKKSSPTPVTSMRQVIEFQRLKDAKGVKLDANQVAEVEAQDARSRLVKQRQHFTDVFAGVQNYLDFIFVDINNLFHSLTTKLMALFTGGFRLAKDFTRYSMLASDIQKLAKGYRNSDQTEEARSDLVQKIIELDALRARISASIGDDPKYSSLRDEMNRKSPVLTNKEVPVEALAGLNESQLVRYYSNYGAEIANRTGAFQGQASRNLKTDKVRDHALAAFMTLPDSLKSKIGSQQFIMLFTMMAASRPGSTPAQVARSLEQFLDEIWGEADKVSKTGFFQKLDVFGWFKDQISQTSGSDVVQKMQLKPSLLRPLADIAGASSDPEVRKALLRGFFRAAAKQPKVVDLLDQTQKRLTREEEASVVAFQNMFRQEARNAIAESSELRASLSKRTQVYTYTQNYQVLGRPVSVSPEPEVPQGTVSTSEPQLNLPRPVTIPGFGPLASTAPSTRFTGGTQSVANYGYRDILPGSYADPTPDRSLGDIIDIIVSDGSSSGEFLIADIEIDHMIYTKVDPATNSQIILDVTRNAAEIQKAIENVAAAKTNEFVEYFIRSNS